MQCEWIVDVLTKQRKADFPYIEAKRSEEEAWATHVQDIANMTLAVSTDSWYMGANVPGKRREMLLYMGGIPMWHAAALKALKDWKGFDIAEAEREKARLS